MLMPSTEWLKWRCCLKRCVNNVFSDPSHCDLRALVILYMCGHHFSFLFFVLNSPQHQLQHCFAVRFQKCFVDSFTWKSEMKLWSFLKARVCELTLAKHQYHQKQMNDRGFVLFWQQFKLFTTTAVHHIYLTGIYDMFCKYAQSILWPDKKNRKQR